MPIDIAGLMADPDFQALPEDRQQALLEKAKAKRGKEYGIPETMRQGIENEGPRANPLGMTALQAAPFALTGPAIGGASKILPFLLRLGTGRAAAAAPAAIPAATKALQSASTGAAQTVQQAAGEIDPQQLMLRFKQIAEQGGANAALVRDAIKQVWPDNWQEMTKQIFAQRTRL